MPLCAAPPLPLLMSRLGIEVLEVNLWGQEGVYGASTAYLSARDIGVRSYVRAGLPSGRHIGCKALRLKSALTQATDAQNGDYT